MAMPGGMPENAEVIGFEIDEEPKWITVRLQDGSVIQIKMEIVSIARGWKRHEYRIARLLHGTGNKHN
jgi:hypothetical protein